MPFFSLPSYISHFKWLMLWSSDCRYDQSDIWIRICGAPILKGGNNWELLHQFNQLEQTKYSQKNLLKLQWGYTTVSLTHFLFLLFFLGGGDFYSDGCTTIKILSQWVWFSMSTRNFISSIPNSAHPLWDHNG